MNRIILVTVFLLTIASITSGSLYWSEQQKEIINKAKMTLKDVEAPEISIGKDSDKAIVEDKKPTSQKTKENEAVEYEKMEPAKSSSPDKKSLHEIKDHYVSLFNELEVQETSKADQLLVQAKADQVSGKFTKSELTTKYQDLSQKLEQNADQTFNVLYEALHSDLTKNDHNTSEAKEFRTTYTNKKEERIERIIEKLNQM